MYRRKLKIGVYRFGVAQQAYCEKCHVWFKANITYPPDAVNTQEQLRAAFDKHECKSDQGR